jgi:HemK-related putative methylase
MDLAERPLSDPLRAKVVRWLWGRVLWWRYRLFLERRHRGTVLERVAGRPILVMAQVFNPRLMRSGELLIQTLRRDLAPPGASVLDMGTGSGAAAVVAAGWAGRVVAVDINPAAVRCAQINVLLSQVEDRVAVRQGDLFDCVWDERFDLVLFNPPFYRGTPNNGFDQAWRATDVIERFAAGLPGHLTPGGRALVVLSSDGETAAFLSAFGQHGLSWRVVAQRDLINEVLTVYDVHLVR